MFNVEESCKTENGLDVTFLANQTYLKEAYLVPDLEDHKPFENHNIGLAPFKLGS